MYDYYMKIHLTQNKIAIIDDSDWPLVSGYSWHADKRDDGRWYAKATIRNGKKHIRFEMHRLILGVTDSGLFVDHRDLDGLNNRRQNLRIATNSQNQFNTMSRQGTSRFKGVSWFKNKNKWRASYFFNGKSYHLGYFDDEVEAAIAYNAAVLPIAGQFARLNDVAS